MKPMTPSKEEPKKTTQGQINKAVGIYRTLLEKHAEEFESGAFQIVLGQPSLALEQFAVVRRRVEAREEQIVRKSKVDRSRAPKEMLDATNRTQHAGIKVIEKLPKGEEFGNEVELIFFKPDLTGIEKLTPEQAQQEYESRGLVPADPYSLGAVNEDDPTFASEHPNATQWMDEDGKWHYIAFDNTEEIVGEKVHTVVAGPNGVGWFGRRYLAGIRKPAAQ